MASICTQAHVNFLKGTKIYRVKRNLKELPSVDIKVNSQKN